MMMLLLLFTTICGSLAYRSPYEFTNPMHRSEFLFSLAPSDAMCFTEDFEEPANYTLAFRSRNYAPIDIAISDPRGKVVTDERNVVGKTLTFLTWEGMFGFCFTNNDIIKGRTVYLRMERTEPLVPRLKDESGNVIESFGPIEFFSDTIYRSIYKIRRMQSDYRAWAEDGFEFTDALNQRVSRLGIFICIIIVLVAVVQNRVVTFMFESSNTVKC